MLKDKELMVYWYDEYDDEHRSKVYHIDANRDRFLSQMKMDVSDGLIPMIASYLRSKGRK